MNIIIQLCYKSAALALITLSSLSIALAQQFEDSDQAIHCINRNRIKNVDIVDNKNIVFQTGVDNYYLNTLPYACNGLRLNDSFSTSTSINELCHVDVITVLNDAGPGIHEGPSCGLGTFEPISREEIKRLKDDLKAQKRS